MTPALQQCFRMLQCTIRAFVLRDMHLHNAYVGDIEGFGKVRYCFKYIKNRRISTATQVWSEPSSLEKKK